MPSLLQRQIFKEIANLFVLAVGVLLTLILISRAVQMRELFLGLDLGILDTVLLFGYMPHASQCRDTQSVSNMQITLNRSGAGSI